MFRCQAYFKVSGEIWQSKVFVTHERARRYLKRHFLPLVNSHLADCSIPSAHVSIIAV